MEAWAPEVSEPVEAKPIVEAPPVIKPSVSSKGGLLDAAKLKAQFSTESYRGMLKSIDECKNFEGAVDLINTRFVTELGWEMDSEAVREFLQLVYRKFAD